MFLRLKIDSNKIMLKKKMTILKILIIRPRIVNTVNLPIFDTLLTLPFQLFMQIALTLQRLHRRYDTLTICPMSM